MAYRLARVGDGAGDSGQMSQAMALEDDQVVIKSDRPTLGCFMRVGSHYGRSYSDQDYWTTTPVTEIIEETEDYVKFRTRNSLYEWWG